MRITIVSAVFPPEPVVSSITSGQLARFLAAGGHDVSVVTGFPNKPKGRLYPGFKRRLFQHEKSREGYRIVRCFSFISSKSAIWSRFLENISFGVTCGWFLLTSCRPGVIIANTWPIFSQGLLAIIARLRGIKFILNIQDLYPESLISQNHTSENGVIAHSLRTFDRWIANKSAAIVVPTPSFAKVYRHSRGIPNGKLHIVPNWVDKESIIKDDIHGEGFRKNLGIPSDARLVFYGGNVGAAAGVETVIESFRYLRKFENLYLIIAGDGANLKSCQQMACDVNNPRVRFRAPWPSSETSQALSAADILVLPTRGRQSLASIPSKLIAYMLAARPILALSLSKSDLAHVIHESGCGWVVPPDQPDILAEKLKQILSQPNDSLRSRGEAGRAYALSHFTGEACLPKFANVITKVIFEKSGNNF